MVLDINQDLNFGASYNSEWSQGGLFINTCHTDGGTNQTWIKPTALYTTSWSETENKPQTKYDKLRNTDLTSYCVSLLVHW